MRATFFPPASLLLLIGYFFLVGSYTVQSFRNPWNFLALPLPLLVFGSIELLGTVLVLYLLLLIAYNTGKMGGSTGPLTVATFVLLFTTQLTITWGFYIFSPIFLWGVACRGFSFFPMLLVALGVQRG